jgi:hypothetical protein
MFGLGHHPRPLAVSAVLTGIAIAAAGSVFPSAPLAGRAPSVTGTARAPGARTGRPAPGTSVSYPAQASATRYTGLAFDAPCTAPSLPQMRAWAASPYRAIGVSVSGVNRVCPEPFLTPSWVAAVSALGWRIVPLDQGLQAPCSGLAEDVKMSWDTATARAQGGSAASGAAVAARAIGMVEGSAIYTDMESYPAGSPCRQAVLSYLSGWAQGLHSRGFLAGVYAGNASGTRHLSDAYFSPSYVRPDAVWNAWYTNSLSLTGWPGVPDSRWPEHQRVRQYAIFRAETHGGVTLVIDNDNADAPVATVAQPRTVTSAGRVGAHRGPGDTYPVVATYPPGAQVSVICQAPGAPGAWDKLSDGTYLRDGYLRARVTRCRYPYQVTASGGAALRAGPSASRPLTGRLPGGALVWIVCQQAGSPLGTTRIWDKTAYRRWVSDRYVATPSATSYSRPAPRC